MANQPQSQLINSKVPSIQLLQSLGYTLGKTLGQGSFGTVKAAWCPYNRKMIAIKVVKKRQVSSETCTEYLPHEKNILPRLHHNNIQKTYFTLKTDYYYFFVLEIAQNGDLYNYVKHCGCLLEEEARYIFSQICSGIAYCHERDIAHRDLKPENILLDDQMNVKIGGFGFAIDEKIDIANNSCGSLRYAAPELITSKGDTYDGKKTDIWSVFLGFFIQYILRIDPKKRPSIKDISLAAWTVIEPAFKPRPISGATPLYTTKNCFSYPQCHH